jgi:hypothetical protein
MREPRTPRGARNPLVQKVRRSRSAAHMAPRFRLNDD